MAKVYPFRGLRYALSRIPIEKVVTQPYDKISKDMQDRYYNLHPNNIVRIILGKAQAGDEPGNNVYTRAVGTLNDWVRSGVLEKVEAPGFYVYFQKFAIPGTSEIRVRKGFIGLGQLEDYRNKIVFPHERTLTGPKKDRLELLRHTRTHFEQIFMLYEDPRQTIDRLLEAVALGKPDIQVEDEYRVMHTLWTVTDLEMVKAIQTEMADKKLIIADGHHRYETALAFRDETQKYERMAMTFFNMDSPGLTILPTHRVLSNVADFDSSGFLSRAAAFFDLEDAPRDTESFRFELGKRGQKQVTVGVCTDSGKRMLFLSLKPSLDLSEVMPDLSDKQRTLDVVILHRLLIEKCLGISEEAVKKESHITYFREMDAALTEVKTGKAQVSFLLNPTGLHQMRDIAYEGNVMPQKSTDFYPKVLSGLMMYTLDE
jgi:uncharacterized protein (DUF1015 family)